MTAQPSFVTHVREVDRGSVIEAIARNPTVPTLAAPLVARRELRNRQLQRDGTRDRCEPLIVLALSERGFAMTFGMRCVAAVVIVILAAAPAQARDWRGRGDYRRGGGGGASAAVIGGLIGLGLGAAIASGNRGYAPPPAYYGAPPGYYAPPPPAVYYGY